MPLIYILLGWLLTFATSLCSGALLLHFLKLRFSWPMTFILGACPVSLLVTLLGFSGLIYKGIFLAVFIGTAALCIHLKAYRSIDSLQITEKWFWAGFAPFLLIFFTYALAPEKSPDGMAYHLWLTDRYYDAHAIIPFRNSMYANLSQGSEMLFLFGYAFGRHSAAALVHFTYLIALPLLIADYATRKGWPLAGAFAGLMVFVTPVVAVDGASAYNDVMIACIWFALFVLTDKFEPERIIPAGMLAGFAYSVKYTAFLTIFFMLWRWRTHWRSLIPACIVSSAFILPWVIKNWLWVDNPFAPFFNAWFQNPYITSDFEQTYAESLRHYNLNFHDAFWSIMVNGEKMGGMLGPVWFLAPLGILQTVWIFPALTYPLNIDPRFLIPVLPFLALGMGKVLSRWRWLTIGVCLCHLLISSPAINWKLAPSVWQIYTFHWRQALRLIPEDHYLNEESSPYRSARLIEQFVPPDEQVFTMAPVANSYTKRQTRPDYHSAENLEIINILKIPLINEFQPTLNQKIQLKTPRKTIRIQQTASGTKDVWSIAEIEPRPKKIRSSDMPFSLDRAFDGNPMTRWYSGFRIRPMWIELEYYEDITEINLWMSHDQSSVRLQVEDASIEQINRQFTSPWPVTKRWATETIRSMGVRYILIDEKTPGFQDFMTHTEDWNFEIIATRGEFTILRMK